MTTIAIDGPAAAGKGTLSRLIADAYGLHWGFIVTALCALYVLFYALWGARPTNALPAERLDA